MPDRGAAKTKQILGNILKSINNLRELVTILKSLKSNEDFTIDDKVDMMLAVFTTESEVPKYDLITYLWNFLKDLYNSMDKRIIRLIPAIGINRAMELPDKQKLLYKEITTRIYYVMCYMKDSTPENVEVMCRNVLLLSKYLAKDRNYVEFFNLAKDSFFNPKHMYQLKILSENSTTNDMFLEHYLTRLWEFRATTDSELAEKGMSSNDLFEKFFQIFVFYLNYEDKTQKSAESKYKLTDKLISVLLNLELSKAKKEIYNSIKCLYSLVQFMKGDCGQELASKGFHQYMERICDKTILNTYPVAVETLATVGIILEKSAFFVEEQNLKNLSPETLGNLLQTIKLTVGLNVEPKQFVCEMKDCEKGHKKHTITNWTRFAQKIFVAHVNRLRENDPIDEDILAIVKQLVIFHFHVMDRLQCPSRIANEHNDVRRLYTTFAHRSKSNPHSDLVKIFEILLKYVLQRNLAVLMSPLAVLLGKYYAELNDQFNASRIDWLCIICLHGDAAQSASFNTYCYNWAVKKQGLAKDEVASMLLVLRSVTFDYQSEIIPKTVDWREVFLRIMESITAPNYKALRGLQEGLVDSCMTNWTTECSHDIVNLLFFCTENQVGNYKEAIVRNQKFFEDQPDTLDNRVAKSVLYSLTYQVYNSELRNDLKSMDINVLLSRELDLSVLSVARDSKMMLNLRKSLDQLDSIRSVKQLTLRQLQQVIGTLKRNIRFFQLAGEEFEEVRACRLLYQLGKESEDAESALLAMANLINHVHFIIKDERCRKSFPKLIRLITGEGSNLLTTHLKTLSNAKESLQTLIVFGMGNLIKLNADLGRREKCYDYLEYLKIKIDEIYREKDEPGVADMQYNLINYQLFLKYSQKSKVNHLVVARELFSAVRLLHKASDLYALYLYDVLIELFCFSVPRYETKGLDYYICIVLKYFMGIGSLTRSLDVLLVYSNWALYCESLDKCLPAMEYIAEILTRKEDYRKDDKVIVKKETGDEISTERISLAIQQLPPNCSVRLSIVFFKLNCLLARKFYVDNNYEQAKKLYEHAWKSYEELNERINSYSLKTELQQFYVNVLFQLSNVYYKMGKSAKSLSFCETTTSIISNIRVNRIALTQEAYFQGMIFKSEISTVMATVSTSGRMNAAKERATPVSPMEVEMAKLVINEKKACRSTKKKVVSKGDSNGSAEGTPSKNRRGRPSAKGVQIKLEKQDAIEQPISFPKLTMVDENSSVLGNRLLTVVVKTEPVKEGKRKTTTRKIPVRTTKSTTINDLSTLKSSATTSSVSRVKTESAKSPVGVEATIATRKTSRRLL